jgi:hypothetical protein
MRLMTRLAATQQYRPHAVVTRKPYKCAGLHCVSWSNGGLSGASVLRNNHTSRRLEETVSTFKVTGLVAATRRIYQLPTIAWRPSCFPSLKLPSTTDTFFVRINSAPTRTKQVTLKMDAVCSSETSVHSTTTRCKTQDYHLHESVCDVTWDIPSRHCSLFNRTNTATSNAERWFLLNASNTTARRHVHVTRSRLPTSNQACVSRSDVVSDRQIRD